MKPTHTMTVYGESLTCNQQRVKRSRKSILEKFLNLFKPSDKYGVIK